MRGSDSEEPRKYLSGQGASVRLLCLARFLQAKLPLCLCSSNALLPPGFCVPTQGQCYLPFPDTHTHARTYQHSQPSPGWGSACPGLIPFLAPPGSQQGPPAGDEAAYIQHVWDAPPAP